MGTEVDVGRGITMIKIWKWRTVIILICLAGCVVFTGGLHDFHVCAASRDIQGEVAQGSTAGIRKQGVSGAEGAGGFVIDNQNIYEGMGTSYAGGYVPKIEKEEAVIVLPLLAKRKLSQNQVTASLRFGEAENLPFVYKNYEKGVSFGYHKTGGTVTGCYLVVFRLELKKERYNGSYPVILSVNAEDETGDAVSQEFTVYVTIADGKGAGEDKTQGTSDTGNTSFFFIDNKNVYAGMGKSYSEGYIPGIVSQKGQKKAVIVLPLLAKRKLSQSWMTVSLKFGETENLPFLHKNYQKEVAYGYHMTGTKGKRKGCYLVAFHLALKKEYYNGSYPVVLSVDAEDKDGNEISQDFTVYVTVTDGKKVDGEGKTGGSLPKFAPKVMISYCQFSDSKVLCGKKSTAKLTLRNTSKTDSVHNMMVTVSPGENVELLGATGSHYVERLGADGICNISFVFRVNATAPCGQYNIGVTMDYADSKGSSYTVEGAVKVSAGQQVQLETAPVNMPQKIQLGETVELQTQAMNLGMGKLYHVRAMVEADGLMPSGTAFIGDMEAGTSMTGCVELTAEGLSGDSLYGTTQGKIIFYYEDEMGNEMTQEQIFETSILSPLSENDEEEPADDTRQWWVIMAVIAVFLAQAAVIFFVRRSKQNVAGNGD